MKRFLLSAASICSLVVVPVAAHASTPAHRWSQRFGDTSVDWGVDLAVDGSGNVVVIGSFNGIVNFGGADLTSAGGDDIFVAKYSSAGVHQWSQRFGSASSDAGYDVAVDGAGNMVVIGSFYGTTNFGGSNLTSVGNNDIFVAKYNSAGVHQWSQRFGDTSTDVGFAVAVDGAGNVLVTGYFSGTVNFGGANLTSGGSVDIFVAKYNSAGEHQWSQRFGSTLTDLGNSVAVDGAGNALVTGYFTGTVNFGGADLTSAGSNDIFAAKYNSAGVHQWSQRFGSTLSDLGNAVAVDGSGNALVTGYFTGTVNFEGTNLTSAGDSDIFVAKYNSAGVHQWSQRFGGTLEDWGINLTVDGSDNVLLTGFFQDTVDFGGGDLTSVGSSDVFIAKYNSAGVHQWSQGFGSTLGDAGYSVAVEGSGNVLATGYFRGTANFGGADLTSAGDFDIFVAKYTSGPAEPGITAITDIGNDQGREVRIEFERSEHDAAESYYPVVQYEAYRRSDALASPLTAAPAGSPPHASPLDLGWVFAGAVPAHGASGYLIDVPTDADSTIALGQHYSAFFIRAATANAVTYFDSPPDSGYSLDNLAPGIPSSFAYSVGQLTWDESPAEDFDYFSVYGSNAHSFGTATLIDYSVTPAMDVTASPYVFYFATATDFSGNEGKPAVVNTLSGVGGTPESYVLSISSYPNPFNPETTIRYTLPSKGRVSVNVYGARGAFVAALVDEDKDAGAYTKDWDGRDANGGTVSSGVYFARVTHASGVKSYKMVLLK